MNFSSNQELFDFVVKALISQGESSMNGDICAIRGKNGAKCAMGHLISDDDYLPWMEEKSACNLFSDPNLPPTLANLLPFYNLIDLLQIAHDCPPAQDKLYWLRCFKQQAKKIARDFSLNWNFD